MTDITIPPAALEAGARTLCSRAGYEWTITPDVHNHWRAETRAAFLAMLEAWPGMGLEYRSDNPRFYNGNLVILPLPQEASDE